MKIQFSIVFLALVVVGVLGSQRNSQKERSHKHTSAVDPWVFLKKATRALAPYKEELMIYSTQVMRHLQQRTASDPKARSAAVGKSRALVRQGTDLVSKVRSALSPMQRDAKALLSMVVRTGARKAGLTSRQEQGIMYTITNTLIKWNEIVNACMNWLVGTGSEGSGEPGEPGEPVDAVEDVDGAEEEEEKKRKRSPHHKKQRPSAY